VSVRDRDKPGIVEPVRKLLDMGFELIATVGTEKYLTDQGLKVGRVNKVLEGQPHIVDLMKDGRVDLVFNTTEGAKAIEDSRELRRTALSHRIPYYTTLAGSQAAVLAIEALRTGSLEVAPLQSYT
jgi:carbamoyl-phosphate synthase large subunit